ncbi:MAG TPA: hypothetical protein VF883_13435 [Thermoanaerobaculia bacterium]|jgi:hypothetical protein
MIYRKQGSVARWENGTLIRVTESGVAREDGDFFESFPEPAPDFRPPLIEAPNPAIAFTYERLILTEGYAEHEYGDRRWSERTRRLHASITHGRLRALVDQAHFDMTHLERVAHALQRAEQTEREAPKKIVLAPNITAAVLPFLANTTQTAGGVDGYGNDILQAAGEWPNFYRPSYRVRPVRMPHNLRLEHDVTDIDPDLPRAIALLAPVDSLSVKVLVVDGERVYPTTVQVTKIHAVGREREWYPYGAGSFGAELML